MSREKLSTTAPSPLEENVYRWTPRPQPRWFRQNGLNLNVQIEDISEKLAALALQGPTSAKLLKAVADADIANLKYFRVTQGKIAGVPVDISRTGYTGDLGYKSGYPAVTGQGVMGQRIILLKSGTLSSKKANSSTCTPPECWRST